MKFFIKIAQSLRKVSWFILCPETYGVKALIIKGGKVLLIKNTYDNFLFLPGGGIKKNETPEEAITRELKEEAGVETKKLHIIGLYTNQKEYKKDNIQLFYVDDFELKKSQKSAEIETANFYPLHNLPKNVSSATLKRIKLDPSKVEEGLW